MFSRLQGLVGSEQFRFLVVAGINTALGFGLFVGAVWVLGESLYGLALIISHVVASTVAFVLYRRMVFFVRGRVATDFLRFQAVYLVALFCNGVLLYLGVEVLGLRPIPCQVFSLALVGIGSYFAHRFFSFARLPLREQP